MRLFEIHAVQSPLLDGIMLLYEAREPTWPSDWADQAFNNPKFRQWLVSLGVNGPIGRPMHGTVGRAYRVGDFIVKFTTDNHEAQAAAILKGHDSPSAADVYGVIRLSSHDHGGKRKNLYAIVMQKLNTGVGGKMRTAANAVYSYLDKHYGFIDDPAQVANLVITKFVNPKVRGDSGVAFAVNKIVRALYDVQKKTGVLSQDPHGGNVAFKGREPAFFDFGRSKLDLDHPKSDGARISSLG